MFKYAFYSSGGLAEKIRKKNIEKLIFLFHFQHDLHLEDHIKNMSRGISTCGQSEGSKEEGLTSLVDIRGNLEI